MSAGSQSYWERKNQVIFPPSFEPTMSWSVDFARQVREWADKRDASFYLMPIRTDLKEYLHGVFA